MNNSRRAIIGVPARLDPFLPPLVATVVRKPVEPHVSIDGQELLAFHTDPLGSRGRFAPLDRGPREGQDRHLDR